MPCASSADHKLEPFWPRKSIRLRLRMERQEVVAPVHLRVLVLEIMRATRLVLHSVMAIHFLPIRTR